MSNSQSTTKQRTEFTHIQTGEPTLIPPDQQHLDTGIRLTRRHYSSVEAMVEDLLTNAPRPDLTMDRTPESPRSRTNTKFMGRRQTPQELAVEKLEQTRQKFVRKQSQPIRTKHRPVRKSPNPNRHNYFLHNQSLWSELADSLLKSLAYQEINEDNYHCFGEHDPMDYEFRISLPTSLRSKPVFADATDIRDIAAMVLSVAIRDHAPHLNDPTDHAISGSGTDGENDSPPHRSPASQHSSPRRPSPVERRLIRIMLYSWQDILRETALDISSINKGRVCILANSLTGIYHVYTCGKYFSHTDSIQIAKLIQHKLLTGLLKVCRNFFLCNPQ